MSETTVIEENEARYVIELAHMKSGSNIILAIKKLRCSGDDLTEVMADVREALSEYIERKGE